MKKLMKSLDQYVDAAVLWFFTIAIAAGFLMACKMVWEDILYPLL